MRAAANLLRREPKILAGLRDPPGAAFTRGRAGLHQLRGIPRDAVNPRADGRSRGVGSKLRRDDRAGDATKEDFSLSGRGAPEFPIDKLD